MFRRRDNKDLGTIGQHVLKENMHFFNKYFIGFLCVILLLLSLPWLLPTSGYLPRLEGLAESQLNQKVKIKGLSFGVLPRPYARLEGVEIGQPVLVSIEAIRFEPRLISLLTGEINIARIGIVQPTMSQASLSWMQSLLATSNQEASTRVGIEHVQIERARLMMDGIMLPRVDVSARFILPDEPQSGKTQSGKTQPALQEAEMTTEPDEHGGILRAVILPQGSQMSISITGKEFMVPGSLPVRFDLIQAQAMLNESGFELQSFMGKLYAGDVQGEGALRWGKRWRAEGRVKLSHLAIDRALKAIQAKAVLEGQLDATLNLRANAESASGLMDHLHAAGPFSIHKGVLRGVDLLKIATVLVTKRDEHGHTAFDTLSGQIDVKGSRYRLHDLNIDSGLLHAEGEVSLQNKVLDGLIRVEVKRSASLVGVPLQLSGSLQSPTILPTKSAMAGAAVGTAILGPGVGTSVGIKVGDTLQRIKGGLLGKKKNP